VRFVANNPTPLGVVAKPEAKRSRLIQNGIELQDERANVSLAAHTGDAKARKRLDEINRALAEHGSELDRGRGGQTSRAALLLLSAPRGAKAVCASALRS